MSTTDAFKQYYLGFNQEAIAKLDQIYTSDIVFIDPIHEIKGLDNVKQYFSEMCGNLSHCQFSFHGETIADDSAWFKWVMEYRHPRLKSGKLMSLTGATYIRYDSIDSKIKAHEDFYDMGSMIYEHIPLLGGAVGLLKQRLAKTA